MRRQAIFFFSSRRRHTRLQGDWSSDVCSSDLGATALDCENTINRPNSTNTITIGSSQYFFSWRRNWMNSDSTRLFAMTSFLRSEERRVGKVSRAWEVSCHVGVNEVVVIEKGCC